MSDVYTEFVRELEVWRRKYQSHPEREILHLLFLGLEREEIVAVAYGEAIMLKRLRRMPISDGVRELISHALLWAWKDEEMHAIYIRGAIFRLGDVWLKGRALLRQMAGMIGGWACATLQHVQWSVAPLASTAATLITGLGMITGQVPEDVRKHLRYGPFRNFCLFNVDAERTAWLCYQRLLELMTDRPEVTHELLEDIRRMQDDEERHFRVFEILAAALDDQDRLVPEETETSLAQKLETVGEFFLPRRRRKLTMAANPVGSGGQVWVRSGASAEEKLPLFRRLLEESGLAGRLIACAQARGKPLQDLRVAIKPTFMLGYHRKDRSPITDPVLLDELARYLHDQGCGDVAVVEARNVYDHFYSHRTVAEVAQYFGIASPYFRAVDLSEEQVSHVYFRGMAQYTVGRTWKEADFRISFGKLRSHPIELVHLTVGNLEGLGARCDEFIFSERQAHRDTAVMMLLGDFPPHFALLDGYDVAPDGLLGIMGAPRPQTPRRIYAGTDALAVDLVAARHLGVDDLRASGILRAACHWFGNPIERTEVIGLDAPVPGWRSPYHNEWSTLLSLLAYPVYELGSWRGALFVPEMDEAAFPLINREHLLLRLGRRGLQALLGLRHSK